jgi:hypothetical protein
LLAAENLMKIVAATLVFAACAATPDELAEEVAASTVTNGQNLNGQNLNGQNLNGQNLNGQNLNGPDAGSFMIWTSLLDAKLDGKVFDATLHATVFSGVTWGISGTGFTGVELEGMRGDGETVRLRIREVLPPATGEAIWRYQVELRASDLTWQPICRDASGAARAAIPVDGVWDHRQGVPGGGAHIADPTRFTFACEHVGAIAKCVQLGYEPWAAVGETSLANHHQACVRLLRGDYCGTGTPYTQDGNRVNLYDGHGIQDDTEDWFFEAEWDQHGARCFHPLNRSRAGIPCYNARLELGCGAAQFRLGTLLVTETPTLGLTP